MIKKLFKIVRTILLTIISFYLLGWIIYYSSYAITRVKNKPKEVSWEVILTEIENCNVKFIASPHAGPTTIHLIKGGVLTSKDIPHIDEVYEITKKTKENCEEETSIMME